MMTIDELLKYSEVCDKVIDFYSKELIRLKEIRTKELDDNNRKNIEIEFMIIESHLKKYQNIKKGIIEKMTLDLGFVHASEEILNYLEEKEQEKNMVI